MTVSYIKGMELSAKKIQSLDWMKAPDNIRILHPIKFNWEAASDFFGFWRTVEEQPIVINGISIKSYLYLTDEHYQKAMNYEN